MGDKMVEAVEAINKWGREHSHEFTNLDDEMIHFAQPQYPSLRVHSPEEEQPLSEETKRDVLDNIDLNANAFAFKFEPTSADYEAATERMIYAFTHGPKDSVVISSKGPEVKMHICKHCFRAVKGVDGSYIHDEGLYRGKARCDPQDSQLVYGYNADPVGAECSPICLGAK